MPDPGKKITALDSIERAKADLPEFLRRDGFESTVLLMNAIGDGVVAIAKDGLLLYSNQSARTMLGYRKDQITALHLSHLLENEEAARQIADQVFSGDVIATDEYLLRHRNGNEMHVILTGLPVAHEGKVTGGIVVFRDITPSVLLNLTLKEREEILRGIFNILPSGIMLQNAVGSIVRINGAAHKLLGLGDADYRGRAFPDDEWQARDLRGDPVPFEDAPFNQALRNGRPVRDRILHAGDPETGRYLLVSSSPLRQEEDEPPMVVTTFTDIDRQFRIQRSLETAVNLNHQINGLLQDLLTEMGPGETMETAIRGVVTLTQADFGAIATYDPRTEMLRYQHSFGADPPLIGFEVPLAQSPASIMLKEKRAVVIDDYPPHPLAVPEFLRRGARVYMGAPIFSDGKLTGVVVVMRKESAPFGREEMDQLEALCPVLSAALFKARYEQRLAELATKDSLTGLWNRRVFFESLSREIDRSKRYDSPFSSLMLDLDFFKSVNDTHGHLAGDQVLKALGRVLRRVTRSTDIVSRTGGEEFMIILVDTKLPGALRTAEKVQKDVEAMVVEHEGKDVKVTVSVGCAEWRKGESQDEFYARLDKLLYRSKEEGRNRISWDPG